MNLLEFVLPTVLNYNLKSKSKVFDADEAFGGRAELPHISTRPTHRRQGRQHITSTAVIKIMMLFIVRISIKWTAGRVRMRTSLLCQPSSSSIDSFKHLARH
ncbi:unnamed protein product [Amoebophrya sp. A25]|nr:unnamed protein product [Amoebophrya sp. A25]|eukprot:GSA25T00007270001.1